MLGDGARGPLLRLNEPLSFWGGVDAHTGRIIDRNHPQMGKIVAGTALLLQATRGSSSASSTFLECIRLGTAPSVLVLTERDAVLVVGGAVAWEIYGHGPTIVIVPAFPSTPDHATILVDSVGDVYLQDDALD